jgi:hypothetical protein
MITRSVSVRAILLPLGFAGLLSSCSKDKSITGEDEFISSSSTIAVAASASRGTASGDSVYVIQPCPRGGSRVAITEAELPASAATYLSTNYSGYTFTKAFAVKESNGTTTAYVAVIFYNDKPVAVLFDSSGNFVKVLEQRERGDLNGPGGWHAGGRFCSRDGRGRDTIALNLVPVTILTYITVNYPADTLVKAFRNNHDSSYVVITKNNGLYANVFTSAGVFVRRVNLPAPQGNCVSIDLAALPPSVRTYLDTTYPNYVFIRAFAGYRNNAIQGYVVIINANNTNYAVRFDASGVFVSVRTIW